MKLNVPFYRTEKDGECGPLALKMALSYFGEEHSFDKLSQLMRRTDSGMVWTAGIALAAKKLGFETRFVTLNYGSINEDLDFYKKYANDRAMLTLGEIKKEIRQLSIKVEEKNMDLEELLKYVSDNSISIVLLNWHILRGKEGFHGHIVPIVGYDADNIYVHNPGLLEPKDYFPIERRKFLEAWEAKGTDKDVVVIYKKN